MIDEKVNTTIRISKSVKNSADELFCDLGLNMSTAVNIFLKQAVLANGFPFEINSDPLYSKQNIKRIKESIRDIKEGRCITKTIEELEEMENKK